VVCLAVAGSTPVSADTASAKLLLSGTIQNPGVTEPFTIRLEFWEHTKDNTGQFGEPVLADSTQATFYPGDDRAQPFAVTLATLKEYEIRIREVRMDGSTVEDKAYRFSSGFLADLYDEVRIEVRDGIARLNDVPLSLVATSKEQVNFARVFAGRTGLALVFYFNPSGL
jgi:hypothetical protein